MGNTGVEGDPRFGNAIRLGCIAFDLSITRTRVVHCGSDHLAYSIASFEGFNIPCNNDEVAPKGSLLK